MAFGDECVHIAIIAIYSFNLSNAIISVWNECLICHNDNVGLLNSWNAKC